MSQHSLEIKKAFSAPAEMIYDAWLNPDSVREWMCPGETVRVPDPKIDARVGGKFQFDMVVGGEKMLPHYGEYKELTRPSTIKFTWVSEHTHGKDSLVTLRIKTIASNRCELTLTHELLPNQEKVDAHTGGWTRILDTLEKKISR